jgi:hypothetical protein
MSRAYAFEGARDSPVPFPPDRADNDRHFPPVDSENEVRRIPGARARSSPPSGATWR